MGQARAPGCPTADGYKPPASWRARDQWLHSFFKEMLAELSLARLHASIVVAEDMGVALSLDGLAHGRHAQAGLPTGPGRAQGAAGRHQADDAQRPGEAAARRRNAHLRVAKQRPCRVVAE
mmetsp:Transcript_7773/g.23099  ORF Transcript_7773/g.23099 Transcript_7773/m.23099 type:complete len:121 (+) Transcript_7773:323-685(+)